MARKPLTSPASAAARASINLLLDPHPQAQLKCSHGQDGAQLLAAPGAEKRGVRERELGRVQRGAPSGKCRPPLDGPDAAAATAVSIQRSRDKPAESGSDEDVDGMEVG